MRKLLGFLPAFGLIMGLSQVANAAEVTRVASSFDQDFNGNAFDLHFGVSYDFDFKKAAIVREWAPPGTDRNNLAKDLIYRQFRHTVTPMLEIGLWHDISVYVAMPVVVSDNRNYEFDKEQGSDCVFPEPGSNFQSGSATCVNKTNSTSIRDGIIPRDGFDAFEDTDPYCQFTEPDTDMIFRAPTRRGLDQLHVGLKFGVLSQARKSHLPNWLIGLEGRFAIAKPMTFTRAIQTSDPAGNHRVGRGMHELGAWTALSRRYRWLDPFFGAHWRMALRAGNTEFENWGPNHTTVNPQSQAGAYFGAEIVPWENVAQDKKFSIVLSGSTTLHYNGRGYSEAWELFADSPAMVGDYAPTDNSQDQCTPGAALGRAANDPDTYLPDGCQAYNGITRLDNFGVFGLNAGLNFHMSKFARLNFGVDMTTTTRHFITADSRGRADQGGSPDEVDVPADINPAYREMVDGVGRRYAVDDVFNINAYLNFIVTF